MKTNRRFDQEPRYFNEDAPTVNPRLGCLIVVVMVIVGTAFWTGLIYIFA